VYSELTTDNPIDLTRYQVLNSYNGRIGVINSGGASTGNDANDLSEAVLTAVVNKRAGGQGLILGRKAFQKEYKDGLSLLRAVQDVYLNDDITIA
jgi:class I fructose-bisphosphate aldolase